jgi:hypothetical protein
VKHGDAQYPRSKEDTAQERTVQQVGLLGAFVSHPMVGKEPYAELVIAIT